MAMAGLGGAVHWDQDVRVVVDEVEELLDVDAAGLLRTCRRARPMRKQRVAPLLPNTAGNPQTACAA